ncbi:DUF881 domain-containing protein [Papillibacter cinnamivorans]|uniref:Uncharacterized conserved protein YlxW, UPF0749 family n=1 Tax=Papillibacter cinnamivorans DSM 12816 TaxID=1122930 RepID=A0A1W1YZ17_9FIRM|nr:DUF881 domain-containing protein [Papillibacter cinnamivorans]SMC41439.1 Uncharacterized conserved protein YlxW, UPF0749 family [Papillibacter cinnamivorans DSM 12816]
MPQKKLGGFSIGAVCVLLGFLLTLQFKSVKANTVTDETNATRVETLQSLLNEERTKNDELSEQIEQYKTELDRYHEDAAKQGDYTEALTAELSEAELLAGLTDVEGPGVEVVMQDSTAGDATGEEADYLIHDSDILSVINELRDAGAEAISLNGQRILATSEVRCSGATVSINNVRTAAPFVIDAIGDPETLHGALTMRNGVVDILGQWKISVDVTMSDSLLVPKYNGVLNFQYAKVPGDESGEPAETDG